ncbi:MAG: methionyl-tRNA formyltransferase [Patescibacteria group bacterium]|nr:methionyl-tRNA formyltransferase [Patescibacteria group bacterium]
MEKDEEKINFAFFGSPNFAKIVLEKLIESKWIPSLLICNPDKPFGRKKIITPPATKKLILSQKKEIQEKVKIIQPASKKELEELAEKNLFKEIQLGIVAAFSQIISSKVLKAFPLGVIGVHPSLLPKYRGPSPIQTMILEDEKNIGVTLFLLDEELDHGPIIASETLKKEEAWRPSFEELEKELAQLAGELLRENLSLFLKKKIKLINQDHSKATFTKKFTTQDGFVDLEKDDPLLIERKIRALNPNPGVFTFLRGERIKLLEATVYDDQVAITKIIPAGKKERKCFIPLPLKEDFVLN